MLFVLSIVAMVLAVSCEVPLVLCKSIEADQNNAGVDPAKRRDYLPLSQSCPAFPVGYADGGARSCATYMYM